MSERDAMLAAIIANPADDLPRLVYADWLDENGESERAEFIRIQIMLSRGVVAACSKCGKCHSDYASFTKQCRGDLCSLKRLEYMVSRRHIVWEWHGPGVTAHACLVGSNDWKRGFVYRIIGSLGDLLSHGPAIVAVNPVEVVSVTEWQRDKLPILDTMHFQSELTTMEQVNSITLFEVRRRAKELKTNTTEPQP